MKATGMGRGCGNIENSSGDGDDRCGDDHEWGQVVFVPRAALYSQLSLVGGDNNVCIVHLAVQLCNYLCECKVSTYNTTVIGKPGLKLMRHERLVQVPSRKTMTCGHAPPVAARC